MISGEIKPVKREGGMTPHFIHSFEFKNNKIYITVEDANTNEWWKFEITADSLLSVVQQAKEIDKGCFATIKEE